MKRRLIIAAVLSSMMVLTACSGKSDDGTITITNVSYDPTREFYEKYNKIFESYYEEKYGQKLLSYIIRKPCIFFFKELF